MRRGRERCSAENSFCWFLPGIRLVTILRREAAAGVSAALLHFADACCAAGVAVPPVLHRGTRFRGRGRARLSGRGERLKRLIEGSRFRCLRVLWLACW